MTRSKGIRKERWPMQECMRLTAEMVPCALIDGEKTPENIDLHNWTTDALPKETQ